MKAAAMAVICVLVPAFAMDGQELLPQLYEELRAATENPNGTSLSFTRGNALRGDWILMTDDNPAHGAALEANIRSLIESAERSVDICFLGPPPAPSDNDRFARALRSAVTTLAASERQVSVRILFGFPTTSQDQSWDLRALLAYLIADARRPNRVKVSLAATNSTTSWSHAKMIVVDDRRALVGGHNLYSEAYLGTKPVFDLSMIVDGPAAATAARFSMLLWRFAATFSRYSNKWTTFTATYDPLTNEISDDKGAASYAEPPPPPDVGEGGIPILAVAHNGYGLGNYLEPGVAETWRGEGAPMRQWSDRAMVWLIDHAEKSILISQQDLIAGVKSLPIGNPAITSALGRAINRGVSVFIILSNTYAPNYSGDVAYWWVVNEIRQAMRGTLDEKNAVLAERLFLAPVAYGDAREGTAVTKWPDGTPVANHAKFYMIDERVFYIGSHNMYALPTVTALQEFGYIVESREAAARLLAVYWNPRMASSKGFIFRDFKNVPVIQHGRAQAPSELERERTGHLLESAPR